MRANASISPAARVPPPASSALQPCTKWVRAMVKGSLSASVRCVPERGAETGDDRDRDKGRGELQSRLHPVAETPPAQVRQLQIALLVQVLLLQAQDRGLLVQEGGGLGVDRLVARALGQRQGRVGRVDRTARRVFFGGVLDKVVERLFHSNPPLAQSTVSADRNAVQGRTSPCRYRSRRMSLRSLPDAVRGRESTTSTCLGDL